MLQIFKYNLKQLLHNRSELFWVILFPIILGSLCFVGMMILRLDYARFF